MSSQTLSFQTRSLKELSTYEILKLRQLCLPYGAFKLILRNLSTKRLSQPDKMFITIAKVEKTRYVGWLLEDLAKEYNSSLDDGHCSIHIYSSPQARRAGIASAMIENRLTSLREHVKVWAYVREAEPEHAFYSKIREKFKLNLEIVNPIIYSKKGK